MVSFIVILDPVQPERERERQRCTRETNPIKPEGVSYCRSSINLNNVPQSLEGPKHEVLRSTFGETESTESGTFVYRSEGDLREPIHPQ